MTWIETVPVFAAGALVLFGPGLLAGLVLRLKGFAVAALAAPLSLAGIAAMALASVVVPFRWSVWTWLVGAVLVVGVAVLVRLWQGRTAAPAASPPDRRAAWMRWAPAAALVVAVALLLPRVTGVIGDPSAISQTFDNVYHLNAVRFVLDEGVIAPTGQLIPGFYPSLWHALTAVVVLLTGATIPVAVSVVAVLLCAVVWPASCIALVVAVVGLRRPAAVLAGGVLAASVAAFPYLLLDFGILYPNVLGLAMLPVALAVTAGAVGAGAAPQDGAVVRWALLIAVVPTLALAHPNTLMALLLLGCWPCLYAAVAWWRTSGASTRVRALMLTSWTVLAGAALLLFVVARPTREQAFWEPPMGPLEAVREVLLNEPVSRPAAVTVSVLMLVGVVAVLWRLPRRSWIVLGWLTLGFVYLVCASFPSGTVRYLVTGSWYSDLFRVAALLPVAVVPLAAAGFGALVALVALGLRRIGAPRAVTAVVALAGLIAVGFGAQGASSLDKTVRWAAAMYAPDTSLLTADERALLERVDDHVPSGEVIAGNPWTGAGLAWALGDREVLVTHLFQDLAPDEQLIVDHLRDATPAVCAAAAREGVRWVLDFGTDEVHGADHGYDGLLGLEEAGVAELVDQEGDARLYRFTGCD